jgi:hypothetical protein
MKRLHHPNIIQFVDVFEDADHLMMIMEFCPGQELFDVILNRKFFQEDDAKPIFAQVARALYYLHSLNILHRDVKPENVLISNIPDPLTGGVVAKLLDFGLSKNAGNGSAAKTFVGTPCYVAPEVEYTSKGLGGTYSFPADCWSLGAVLYVMLVARFPEFEQDATGKVVVKLNPALWGNVTNDAKDLIRGLMNTNPAARLTMANALTHPWLGRYRATPDEISRVAVASYDLSRSLQEEEARLEALEREKAREGREARGQVPMALNHIGEMDDHPEEDVEITASGVPVHQQAMVVRVGNADNNGSAKGGINGPGGPSESLQLAPLLHLQRSIADCFDEVHASYKDLPEVASEIRQGAALCREQLTESTKMLRKVEQTAAAVLGMFPDLELAVEEGEPQLAADFFNMVKGWVAELREMVNTTQGINKASMFQVCTDYACRNRLSFRALLFCRAKVESLNNVLCAHRCMSFCLFCVDSANSGAVDDRADEPAEGQARRQHHQRAQEAAGHRSSAPGARRQVPHRKRRLQHHRQRAWRQQWERKQHCGVGRQQRARIVHVAVWRRSGE